MISRAKATGRFDANSPRDPGIGSNDSVPTLLMAGGANLSAESGHSVNSAAMISYTAQGVTNQTYDPVLPR